MARLRRIVHTWLRQDQGAALAEYALLVGFIALVCFAAVVALGSALSAFFQNVVSLWP